MAILNLFYHVDPVGGENGSRTLPLLTSKIFNSLISKKFHTLKNFHNSKNPD